MPVPTRPVPDVEFQSLHRGKSCANPVTLTLILTLLYSINPN